jgi:hypothetical protein
MAPARPYWKGYLTLSLVSCPIALYTGTSATERVSFRQINKKTGNRLRQQLVDEVTREPVALLTYAIPASTLIIPLLRIMHDTTNVPARNRGRAHVRYKEASTGLDPGSVKSSGSRQRKNSYDGSGPHPACVFCTHTTVAGLPAPDVAS